MNYSKKVISGAMLITIFVLVVSLSSLYIQTQIQQGTICTCAIPLPVFVPILASIGLLVGTLVYYSFSPGAEASKPFREPGRKALLKFLDDKEAAVVGVLLGSRGELSQAKITELSGLPKVKVSRMLDRMRARGIIEKKRKGKVNIITLSEDIKQAFPE